MVDRNLQSFYGRLGRIEKIHDAGGGFEANGAIGMSYYNARRRPARRAGLLLPLVLVAMTVVAIKSAVLGSIGDEAYAERVAKLEAGTSVEKAGAWVLQADPLTVSIAGHLRSFFF
ncbi:MAG: hypothetical protein KDE00_10270 [Rhodobacteraceae bacterium]|nr:hypothetical protein [Paracoccaceae bacterium]